MAKQTITITLYKSELVYDVQNKTYLTGRSRQTGSNHEDVANMQANDDDENANQVLRSLGNAFATLKTKLSEYLEESGTSANDIQMGGTANLTVALKVPSNYNPAANDTVSAAMHQYLVNTAIGDWFTITNKADAEGYITLAGANLEQIREAINKRVRPKRDTGLPDYSGQHTGYFYLKGSVRTGGMTIVNPVLYLRGGSVEAVDNEGDETLKLWSYDEDSKTVNADIDIADNNFVTISIAAVQTLFNKYGESFNSSDSTTGEASLSASDILGKIVL